MGREREELENIFVLKRICMCFIVFELGRLLLFLIEDLWDLRCFFLLCILYIYGYLSI